MRFYFVLSLLFAFAICAPPTGDILPEKLTAYPYNYVCNRVRSVYAWCPEGTQINQDTISICGKNNTVPLSNAYECVPCPRGSWSYSGFQSSWFYNGIPARGNVGEVNTSPLNSQNVQPRECIRILDPAMSLIKKYNNDVLSNYFT